MRPEIIGTVEDLDAASLPVTLDRREAGKEERLMLVTMIEIRSIIRALRRCMEREAEVRDAG